MTREPPVRRNDAALLSKIASQEKRLAEPEVLALVATHSTTLVFSEARSKSIR